MSTFKGSSKTGGQTKRKGVHSKGDLAKGERQEFARDNLGGAFAGKQHEVKGKATKGDNTHLSARKTKASAGKTPKR